MPTITTAMFKTGAITAEYSKVSSLCEKMGTLMDKAHRARVTSEAGTDITMFIEGRLKGRDTGLLHKPGDFGNLPAGEVYVAPVEGTAEGTLVFDGTIAKHPLVERGNQTGAATKSEFDLERAFSYRVDISFIRVNHARER